MDFNCQSLPSSYRQLVNVHGVCDATWVAVENPQFRYLFRPVSASLAPAGSYSYCCGRMEAKSTGDLASLHVMLIEAGFLFAQNQQVISAAILLFFKVPSAAILLFFQVLSCLKQPVSLCILV